MHDLVLRLTARGLVGGAITPAGVHVRFIRQQAELADDKVHFARQACCTFGTLEMARAAWWGLCSIRRSDNSVPAQEGPTHCRTKWFC